ncbi:MAG: hypothetical protein AAF657_30675, partial [Acidobacteriota bacterium]
LGVLAELLKAGAESGGPENYDPDYPAPLVPTSTPRPTRVRTLYSMLALWTMFPLPSRGGSSQLAETQPTPIVLAARSLMWSK